MRKTCENGNMTCSDTKPFKFLSLSLDRRTNFSYVKSFFGIGIKAYITYINYLSLSQYHNNSTFSVMCLARRERNLQGLVTEPLSFPFLYVLGEKENPPNWQTPFNLDYAFHTQNICAAARTEPVTTVTGDHALLF